MIVLIIYLLFNFSCLAYSNSRPAPSDRTFHSSAIDDIVLKVSPFLKDIEVAKLFENCLPNTLDTTVQYDEADGVDTFIITGNIPMLTILLYHRIHYTRSYLEEYL